MKKTRKKYSLGTPNGGVFRNIFKKQTNRNVPYTLSETEEAQYNIELEKDFPFEGSVPLTVQKMPIKMPILEPKQLNFNQDNIDNMQLEPRNQSYEDFVGTDIVPENNASKIGVPEIGLISQGIGLVTGAVGELGNTIRNYKPVNPYDRNTGVQYAMGGNVEDVPVEVEGGEIAELPNGQMQMFQGPTHEQGGVNANLPEGTEIFSERLKHPQTGETMAERKLKREARLEKVIKLLNKNKKQRQGDKFIKNSIKRVEQQNAVEEQGDMMIQEQFQQQMQMMARMQENVGQEQPQQYLPGTGPTGIKKPTPTDTEFMSYQYPINKSFFEQNSDFNLSVNPIFNLEDIEDDFIDIKEKSPYHNLKYDTNTTSLPNDLSSKVTMKEKNEEYEKIDSNYSMSQGDKLGLYSTIGENIARPINTMMNRMNTDAPTNTMKGVGDEALTYLDRMLGSVDQDTKRMLGDIQSGVRGARNRLSNSARSVNTIRGIDEMIDSSRREQVDKVQRQRVDRLNALLNKRGDVSLRKDIMEAQGEDRRFDIQEEQRDNFSTNIAQDISSMGQTNRHVARTLNQSKYNKDLLDIMNLQLGNVGVTMNEKGEYEIVNKKKKIKEEEETEKKAFGGKVKKKRKRKSIKRFNLGI